MHRRWMGRWVAMLGSVLLASCLSTGLESQARWDATNNVYRITVHDDSGLPREIRVEPANRVVPQLQLEQVDSGSHIEYRYRVTADPKSPQALGLLRIPCPASAIVEQPQGGFSRRVQNWGDQRYCTFDVGRSAGQSPALVTFRTTLLAGTGRSVAVGSRELPSWPTSEPTEETIALRPLIDSLAGLSPNGLVLRFASPVPMYERALVAQTDSGLRILRHELTTICGTTNWIPSDATCDALAALLPDVNAFIKELEEGRGRTIGQNAFAILHGLASVRRGALRAPSAARR